MVHFLLLGVGNGELFEFATSKVSLSLAIKSVTVLGSMSTNLGANTGVLRLGDLLGLGGSLGSKGGIALVVALLETSSDGIEIHLVGVSPVYSARTLASYSAYLSLMVWARALRTSSLSGLSLAARDVLSICY